MSLDKLGKCFEEGEKGGERHKGLRKINSNMELANDYLKKAIHNFEAITKFYECGFSDWSASAAFYSLYHLLLAILAKKGYESRNQFCTFVLVEDFIKKGEIKNLTIKELKEIFDKEVTDILHSNKILDIRERMQYGTKTVLVDAEFQILKKRTKELFDKLRREFEELLET